MTQYLLRIDDVCPTMKRQPFDTLLAACRAHGVTGILGVVPDNQDQSLNVEETDTDFWKKIRRLAQEGWIVAQHGYQHVYITQQAGLLGLRNRSEFAGLPYDQQYQKIAAGKKMLREKLSLDITWWMAPAHSFDTTTCLVLRELGFTHVTDGIALYPFTRHGLTWVPHQVWRPAFKPFGVWTIGLHLNTISPKRFVDMLHFIKKNAARMQVNNLQPRVHVFNPLFRWYWYAKFTVLKHLA